MVLRGAGILFRGFVRIQGEVCGSIVALGMSPTAAMAASPLCPCPDVPDAPIGPLVIVAGVGATALLAALKSRERRGRRGVLRSVLARLAILLTFVMLLGAIS